jgi:hypothetical protein
MQCLGHRQVQLVTERSLGNGNLGALGQHAVAAPPAHWADGWRSSVGPIPAHVCLSSPTFYSEGVEGSQIPKGGRWPLRSARQAQEWRQFRPRQPSSSYQHLVDGRGCTCRRAPDSTGSLPVNSLPAQRRPFVAPAASKRLVSATRLPTTSTGPGGHHPTGPPGPA